MSLWGGPQLTWHPLPSLPLPYLFCIKVAGESIVFCLPAAAGSHTSRSTFDKGVTWSLDLWDMRCTYHVGRWLSCPPVFSFIYRLGLLLRLPSHRNPPSAVLLQTASPRHLGRLIWRIFRHICICSRWVFGRPTMGFGRGHGIILVAWVSLLSCSMFNYV